MRVIANHVCGIVAFVMLVGICTSAPAHMAFRNHLQQKYPGMKVNCFACHVKKKPKTERNDFGKLFAKELKATNPSLTEEWKSKKGDERKQYETEIMVPAFDKALAIVKTLKNENQEVYDDLIKNGEMPEIKKDPKYKPDPDSTSESGGDPAASETEDSSDENGGSFPSRENPASVTNSQSENG